MQSSIRRFLLIFLLVAVGVAFSGCATRHYVKNQIATIEPQVAEVRNAQSELAERIDPVDRRAQEGLNASNLAATAAGIANERASAADRRAADADRHADAAQVNALKALNRINTLENQENQVENRIANLNKYSVTEQKTVTFKFDSDVLGKEAVSKLNDIAGWVSARKTGYVIELQGFTDSIGTEKYNFSLSERRAESVLRFLVSQGVPLYRISIVGLGKANPVAENKTATGREQNRRVEIRILQSGTVATANR